MSRQGFTSGTGMVGKIIGTWFGSGLMPIGSATAASAVAALMALAAHEWLGWGSFQFLGASLSLAIPAVWAASRLSAARGAADPDIVVVDEVVGQWLTLAGATVVTSSTVFAAFVVFRILDIWKPAPVRQLERLSGGAGIVADDLMAGLYGAVVMMALCSQISP